MTNMLRNTLTLLLLALFALPSFSQSDDKQISKIAFDMVDKKYVKAVDRAEKLQRDSKYRKNAWVYLYLSQGYFEIASDPQYMEDFSRAFKDALKAAYKLAKYSDDDEMNLKVYESHQDFLSTLKDSAITLSEIYYDNENPRKAAYYLGRITKFDEDDYAVWLMKGVYEIHSRNIGEGVKSIKLAMDNIDDSYVPDPVSAQTLVDALEEYALIIKAGEYSKYFEAYKFDVSESQVPELMAMRDDFKKYIPGKVVDVKERKEESKVTYKSFKSEDKDSDTDDEGDEDNE